MGGPEREHAILPFPHTLNPHTHTQIHIRITFYIVPPLSTHAVSSHPFYFLSVRPSHPGSLIAVAGDTTPKVLHNYTLEPGVCAVDYSQKRKEEAQPTLPY
jgi:hypothetical protein